MVIREVTLMSTVLRITLAMILGGCLGMERELKNRPAGLRTYMLVCVGSCLIMLTNQYSYQVFQVGDPVRMGAQVVSGIGFLGAGTIIVTRRSQIKGLTTAAGLWASAAIGLAVGIGFYEAAIAGSAVIAIILTILHRLDTVMHRNTKYVEIYVELSGEITLLEFMNRIRDMGIAFDSVQLDVDNSQTAGSRSYVASLKSGKRMNQAILVESIREIPEIGRASCRERV